MNEYQKLLKENYEKALAQVIDEACITLTEGQFINKYEPDKPWAVGPFQKNEKYTFIKEKQMKDPTSIGWTSSFIFNPSLMVKDDKLFLFYRASVKKESVGSRIGLAIYEAGNGWTDYAENPILFPTEDDEILSVEDPKVYKYGDDQYIMFYNGVWNASTELMKKYDKQNGSVAVDIKYALSSDLIHWEKQGLAVPYDVSQLWAKGAVLARNGKGEAVKINGEYIMFLSEGCGGYQTMGFSKDMLHWRFDRKTYLPLPAELGTHIWEVACAIACEDRLVIDFFYNDKENKYAGGQALYHLDDPYHPVAYTSNATLAWGGLLQYEGKWIFAQGWDAPLGKEEMYFYTCEVK